MKKQCGRNDGHGKSWAAPKKFVLLTACLLLFLLISPAFADNLSGGGAPEPIGTPERLPMPAPSFGHSGLSGIHPLVSRPGMGSIEGGYDFRLAKASTPAGLTSDSAAGPDEQTPPTGAVSAGNGEIETGRNSSESDIEAEFPEFAEEKPVRDPLEPWNRLMFHFNDKLYYWVLKPAAKGYNAALPEPVRTSVSNFFRNVTMPVRFVSSLLAGRVKAAGIELARFGINTTAGLGGLFDIAKQYHLQRQESDLGLTFGRYGIGEGIYIVWPFLGPSSLRDTVGTVGDGFLDPVNYITPERDAIAVSAYEYFNYAALHINDYEDLVSSAVEPYVALRNAYIQHRRSLISK
jgi:phospholipid-binding lipoprotein MlaA